MPAAAQTRSKNRPFDGLAILSRRPKRYVPRHSTREPGPIWDLTAEGPKEETVDSPDVLLRSVLEALDTVPEDGLAFDPAAPQRGGVIDLT